MFWYDLDGLRDEFCCYMDTHLYICVTYLVEPRTGIKISNQLQINLDSTLGVDMKRLSVTCPPDCGKSRSFQGDPRLAKSTDVTDVPLPLHNQAAVHTPFPRPTAQHPFT